MNVLKTGLLSGVAAGPAFELKGTFAARIGGTFVGTAELQRSLDNGSTFQTVSRDAAGNAASYTAPADLVCEETQAGVQYRWNCTAYTSGTIQWSLAQ